MRAARPVTEGGAAAGARSPDGAAPGAAAPGGTLAETASRHAGTTPETAPGPEPGRWARAWARLDRNGLRVFWVVATVALVLQLGLFLGVSTFRYHRFDLYTDFGTYAQAFSVIAHGNLDPFDTFQTYPFWQNHFELAMWPIALLGSVWPHPIVLLWLQDLAVVATELIALLWIGQICIERVGTPRRTVALLALLATVANAWWWEATIFDVHFETLGMPFALLCAYSLWQGRFRTAWVAAVVAVLFGDVVALSVLFVGLAGLLSARVRDRDAGVWHAAGLAAFGLAWLVLVTVLHGNRGSAVPIYYGWIVHEPSNASSWAVYGSLAGHPSAVLHVLRTHTGALWRVVATGGALGLLTPWGLLQAIAVLVPVALNVNGSFWLLPVGAFQTVTAVPFVLVGTVMVLAWVGTGEPPWPRRTRTARAPPARALAGPGGVGPRRAGAGAGAVPEPPPVGPAGLGLGHPVHPELGERLGRGPAAGGPGRDPRRGRAGRLRRRRRALHRPPGGVPPGARAAEPHPGHGGHGRVRADRPG